MSDPSQPTIPFFKNQGYHLLFLLVSIPFLFFFANQPGVLDGEYLGFSGKFWFWVTIVNAILHQAFIWVSWRSQLNYNLFSRIFGKAGFTIYSIKFLFFFLGRFVWLIFLAIATEGSPGVYAPVAFMLLILITLPVLLTLLSVLRYFGLHRAMGIDHFDEKYRDRPLVRKGVFKYTSNAMYTFAILAMFIPGLIWLSWPAMVSGVFQYIYLWVHYYCTEKPDMEVIYG